MLRCESSADAIAIIVPASAKATASHAGASSPATAHGSMPWTSGRGNGTRCVSLSGDGGAAKEGGASISTQRES